MLVSLLVLVALQDTSATAGGGGEGHGSPSASAAGTVGLDLADLDRSVEPCQDFYRFANGGWLERTELLPEFPSYGVMTQLREHNNELLRQIAEEAAADQAAPEGSSRKKIGDLWCVCMDEERLAELGAAPLLPLLDEIEDVSDLTELQHVIAAHARLGLAPLFHLFAEQDARDATRMIATAYQGGLGLPDRDYYTREDDRSAALRGSYVVHVGRMFELLGENPADAARHAAAVMDLETRLALASMTNVEQRDPEAVYNMHGLQEAAELTPRWDWPIFLAELGAPPVTQLNVAQPEFFRAMDGLLDEASLDDWKAYLRWNLVHEMAPTLDQAFVDENFDFYSRQLAGTQQLRPRWKRCLGALDGALGEAIGQEYVARAFSPEAKRRCQEMVDNLLATLRQRLSTLDWMSPETRLKALAKVDTFVTKIGYPEVWRDYSALHISRADSYADNVLRAQAFEVQRDLAKIGQPVDRTEWGMSPSTVNAYYNPSKNEIVFPAGILQAPYFDERQDDALNYGAMGAVIGHEITHGFDDQGSQFDAQGNLSQWWNDADRAEFERRADVVRQQYDDFVAVDDLHCNGSLTLGENIADFGGLTVAYHAYKRSLEGKPEPADLDGFTDEQRFFLAFSRAWRNKARPEFLRLMVNTNPHAPPAQRGMGPLQNMPEFQQAFGCPDDSPALRLPEQRARIW